MKTVLVVDDSLTTRIYYRDILERIGFKVTEAENGLQGLEIAMLEPFDLAIVDVNMPKMDGHAMVRAMRQDPKLSSLPVLTVSTEAAKADAARAYDSGSDYYLVKPASPEDLTLMARMLTGTKA
jgi:two-component system chemotaxis response regulator CheY